MRLGFLLASTVLATASPAQRFGFTHRMLPGSSEAATSAAVGDVDGDGDLDVLVGRSFVPVGIEDCLYLNDGGGIFADVSAANLPPVADTTRAVALGDMDGDGDLDAFLGNWPGPNRFYRNNGAGVFADDTAGNLPAPLINTTAVALGDVDVDGDLDALLGTDLQARLYVNGGGGSFTDATATTLPPPAGFVREVALGDADGDSDPEAWIGLGAFPPLIGGGLRLYLNGGGGPTLFTDVTPTNLPFTFGDASGIELGDVDGDGDLDALWTGSGPVTFLLLNGGAGFFTSATGMYLPSIRLALGDVDGDADLDAFFAAPALYLNGGTGIFTDVSATNLPAVSGGQRVGMGDFDGDGDLDALTIGFRARLYLNSGSGAFAEVSATEPPAFGAVAVALGDLDADGDLDALLGGEARSLLLGDGTGVFTDATVSSLPPVPAYTLAVALGDLDGDGDLDAFLGNAALVGFTGVDLLFLNGGGGTFTLATGANLPGWDDRTQALALGDVDGDGDLDALIGNGWNTAPGSSVDRLYFNDGTGVFTDPGPSTFPSALDSTGGVALGDLDGDGDLDAYLANGGQDRLYVRTATGAYVDATASNLPVDFGGGVAVALGDMEGDGDLDAFVGNAGSSGGDQNRLLLNDSTGDFTDVTATNVPSLVDLTRDVALGDVDEDGDLDALVVNALERSRLLLNSGTGFLTDVTAAELPNVVGDNPGATALGDVDGDGDLDAFVAVPLWSRLYVNLTRQLAWRGVPRTGRPLSLELQGPASGTWLLAAAAAPGILPIPPFGTLRLELPTLFIVAGGVLDPQGRTSLSFPVPASPSLVGGSLFWQAVVGPPLRFTNLEVTTVTDL